jgi:predicted nucleotidyltransferase component of viral defense system
MIPRAFISEWQKNILFRANEQVEQDMVICRTLIELYNNDIIKNNLLFRGGTALHKIYISPQVRYSEDIDFVQKYAGSIGNIMTVVRNICNPFLGEPKWKQSKGRVTFLYNFNSEVQPVVNLKLKIEINTREHINIYPTIIKSFEMKSKWFSGKCEISTYSLEELLGTKLRALYQRKKGRDLFDLWYAITNNIVDEHKIIKCFKEYIKLQNIKISSKQFIKNMDEKLTDINFLNDTNLILRPEIKFNIISAYDFIKEKLLKNI